MIHGLSQPNGRAQIGDTGSNSALDQISEILPQLFGIYLFGEQEEVRGVMFVIPRGRAAKG